MLADGIRSKQATKMTCDLAEQVQMREAEYIAAHTELTPGQALLLIKMRGKEASDDE